MSYLRLVEAREVNMCILYFRNSTVFYRTRVVVDVELLLPLQLVGKVVVVVGYLAVGAEVQGLENKKT